MELATWSSGVATRVAVTTMFSGAVSALSCAKAGKDSTTMAAVDKKNDFNMTSPDRVQEPARQQDNGGSKCPATPPTLSPRRFTPRVFGAPAPQAGRQCEAGFLAPGFLLSPAFPNIAKCSVA